MHLLNMQDVQELKALSSYSSVEADWAELINCCLQIGSRGCITLVYLLVEGLQNLGDWRLLSFPSESPSGAFTLFLGSSCYTLPCTCELYRPPSRRARVDIVDTAFIPRVWRKLGRYRQESTQLIARYWAVTGK